MVRLVIQKRIGFEDPVRRTLYIAEHCTVGQTGKLQRRQSVLHTAEEITRPAQLRLRLPLP